MAICEVAAGAHIIAPYEVLKAAGLIRDACDVPEM